jgi:hypothetical protein
LRHHQIVTIENGDPFATRKLDRAVAGGPDRDWPAV